MVGICVVSDEDVEDVVLRDDGVLAGSAPGTVIAIHSTVHPETCRRIAERAAARDVGLVDAPVSGGGIAAAEGKLLVMVGGDADVVERVRPVLATYGDPIIHLGNVGSGQMAKVLNNFLFTAQLTVAVETFDFAARLGVDRAALGQVLCSRRMSASCSTSRKGPEPPNRSTSLRSPEPPCGCSRSASDPARRQPSATDSASTMRGGVNGAVATCAPTSASASFTALATAAGAPMAPPSPTPL